jgi:hypothetical protein
MDKNGRPWASVIFEDLDSTMELHFLVKIIINILPF